MTTRKLLITLLAITQFVMFAQGQADDTNMNMIESGMPLTNVLMIGRKVPAGGVKGDQYLFDSFQEGKIVFANSKFIDKVQLNYDAYEKFIYFKIDKYSRVIEPENVQRFETSLGTYKPFPFEDDMLMGLVLVSTENVSLMESPEVYLKEPTYNVALDMGSRDFIYKKKTKYFLQVDGADYVKLKPSAGKNIKELNVDGLKEFCKKEKVSWDSKEDLIQVASFIQSQLSSK